MAREKFPVIRHVESGEVFSFEDSDYDNAVGVFMKSKGWTYKDVEWLAEDYYAVTWKDDPDGWNLAASVVRGADPSWPLPIGIEVFGFLQPRRTFICSLTPSQFIHVVEYRPLWEDSVRDREDFGEINEWWFAHLSTCDYDDYCLDYSSYVDAHSRPRREKFTAVDGPYYFTHEDHETEREREDAMREFCQSNPPL